ncbi:MAG: glycoside hydrolase [Clostridia bacterium]|nr:glycoside hydrolase [Clostridia bacterium]
MLQSVRKGLCLILIIIVMAVTSGMPAGASWDYKYNMSYIYFGNSSDYTQLVDNTQNSLNEVAPNYFSLSTGGELVLTNAVSSSFVQQMHDEGILVVPYLSNDWDRDKGLAALGNMDALADQLADAVSEYDLDGVNIDIENLTPSERDDYVSFVKLLREKLPEGKLIVAAVAANPSGTSVGWTGSYDYAGLAEYCDYLMVMAYDESYNGSVAGPVASISFVENSIKYALSVVSKDKIVLGLPFYGRIWSNSGGFPYGYGISNTVIEELIDSYSGTVTHDENSMSACAKITVKASDTKPKVGGQVLAAGTYTIWYSDETSLKAELKLVSKYGIMGAGSWSLGQETDDTWDYYKLWLNGCTFSDVQNSWAKDYVLTAYLNGWMNGVSAGEFSPASPLTRAQAAALMVRMLGLTAVKDSAYSFDDCSGSWAEAYIDTARKYDIVSGVGDNTFEPDRPVTREEIAVMLYNIMAHTGITAPTAFSDVTAAANPWSYDAIGALGAKGVITGYPDGSFRPDAAVTRAEIAAMITRTDASQLTTIR